MVRPNIGYNGGMKDRSDWPSGLTTLTDQNNHSGSEDTTADERVASMWQLAVDAWAMMGEHVAEREFQRHIGGIERRGS